MAVLTHSPARLAPLARDLLWLSCVALCAAPTLACAVDEDPVITASGGPSWDEFRANPPKTWDDVRAATPREQDAPFRFIVDGDLPMTEPELRAHYDAWLAQEYAALTAHGAPAGEVASGLTVKRVLGADVLWPLSKRETLTYCIENGFGPLKATLVSAMARATASWADRAAVKFVYVPSQDATCTTTNPNVVFSVLPAIDPKFYAMAFFPDAPRAARLLKVTEAAFSTTAGGRDLEGILRHETGHILGFRHEHIRIGCEPEANEADRRDVTAYDVNSVMHYPQCRPSRAGGYRQSPLDEAGATTLYGAPRTTECLFNWAQATYPTQFSPAATTAVSGTFVYRYYPRTNNYLGIDTTDQNVYVLPSGGTLQSQGSKASWLTLAGCN